MKKYLSIGVTMIYSIVIGGMVGLITWLFLTVVNLGIHFFWEYIPNNISFGYFTITMCTIGGVLVGLCQKYFGTYPRLMPEVLKEFKETKSVQYKGLYKVIITALIVLWFGASLGPEAALVGIIGGIVTLAGEFLKYGIFRNNDENSVENIYKREVTESSMEATLGIIFGTPLYGFANIVNQKDTERFKKIKTIIYTITIGAGFMVFMLLSEIDNRASFVTNFGKASLSNKEFIAFIPLTLIGIFIALYYKGLGKLLKKVFNPLKKYKILKAILGGIILGGIASVVPYILFSGEYSLENLLEGFKNLSPYTLILIGLIKLFATEVCLSTGWRGGHIFPMMFSGAAIGFGVAGIFNLDPVFTACILMTSILSSVMGNAMIVIFLLVLFFPLKLSIFIIIVAMASSNLTNKLLLKLKM